MRAYLVKEEATFERLAIEKVQEDEMLAQGSRVSSGSAQQQQLVPRLGPGAGPGSGNNSGLNSYNNSSDESARGGSTNSKRGRGKSNIASRGSVRNRSSENHLSTSARIPRIEEFEESPNKGGEEVLTGNSEGEEVN